GHQLLLPINLCSRGLRLSRQHRLCNTVAVLPSIPTRSSRRFGKCDGRRPVPARRVGRSDPRCTGRDRSDLHVHQSPGQDGRETCRQKIRESQRFLERSQSCSTVLPAQTVALLHGNDCWDVSAKHEKCLRLTQMQRNFRCRPLGNSGNENSDPVVCVTLFLTRPSRFCKLRYLCAKNI